MYVDDIIGVCFEQYLLADLQRTREICTDLMDNGAVADERTESDAGWAFLGKLLMRCGYLLRDKSFSSDLEFHYTDLCPRA